MDTAVFPFVGLLGADSTVPKPDSSENTFCCSNPESAREQHKKIEANGGTKAAKNQRPTVS
ncbi:hypothetical protein [Pedobacter sp. KACC 23697]|uniref:Uncharacterized protein n=1 Tax=Pedobacter sp. KACC 23697 TaxID=3149230 RepID=A0AAU7K3N8_9SPHI